MDKAEPMRTWKVRLERKERMKLNIRPEIPQLSSLDRRNPLFNHVVGLFYVNKYRQNVVFVRHGLVDCVMETEKMICCFAALSEAGLQDMKDIMIL